MERPFEQFTVDRAPTVETLVDEKNPTVRAYTENLRHQVATIAAKYGANARDVFRKEVQDRMDVDDLAAVARLVKRIGAFSDAKADRKESVELEQELSRLERKAREFLTEQRIESFMVNVYRGREMLVKMYLRAGMVAEALALAEHDSNTMHSETGLRVLTAFAITLPDMEHRRANLRSVMMSAGMMGSGYIPMDRRLRAYETALDLWLSISSDQDVLALRKEEFEQESGRVRLYLIDRLGLELERRNLSFVPHDPNDRAEAEEEMQDPDFDFSMRNYYLFLAEAQTRAGREPNALLRPFVEQERHNPSRETFDALVQTAARIKADKTVEELASPEFWRGNPPDGSAYRPFLYAADGCAKAGRIEKAIAYFDRDRSDLDDTTELASVGRKIVDDLLDADEIARAEYVWIRSYMGDLPPLRTRPVYEAARARRGDDILDGIAERLADDQPQVQAHYLLNAAIATFGFVNGMRARIAASS